MDRMGVPPGMEPKLPDPKPASEPRKPAMNAKRTQTIALGAAAVIIVALVAWLFSFMASSARTPAQAVARAAGEGITVGESLAQVSVPGEGERSVLFFISNEEMACALLNRKPSGYKVLAVSGQTPLVSGGKQGSWEMLTLKGDDGFFVYGMLYDGAVSAVEVNGVPAVIVNNGVYRCWFYYGESSMSIRDESVVFR